jgi:hypothetical protein
MSAKTSNGKPLPAIPCATSSPILRARKPQFVRVGHAAFEGAHGFPKRAEAQRRHYGFNDDPPLRVMPGRMDLIREHKLFIAHIKQALAAHEKPAVVVLDTLNRSLVGSESSDKDMASYIAAASAIYEASNCLVMIVHHCGWDESRPRGHSSLPGAIEVQIAIVRDGDNITSTVEFLRDGPDGAEINSVVKTVPVGEDARGKMQTSLVVLPGTMTAKRDGGWPKSLSVFRLALREALKNCSEQFQDRDSVFAMPVRAVAVEAVRREFYATYNPRGEEDPKQRQNAKRQRFYQHLELAQKLGLIRYREPEHGEPIVWLTHESTTWEDTE